MKHKQTVELSGAVAGVSVPLTTRMLFFMVSEAQSGHVAAKGGMVGPPVKHFEHFLQSSEGSDKMAGRV